MPPSHRDEAMFLATENPPMTSHHDAARRPSAHTPSMQSISVPEYLSVPHAVIIAVAIHAMLSVVHLSVAIVLDVPGG
jgi:hypothetical protein